LTVDLSSPFNAAFTAAMLVAFFGFFRKANICPAKISRTPAEDTSPVRRCDFEFSPGLALVWVILRRTKTIQYGQRILQIGQAIVRMMPRRGLKCLIVYVDDFIIICPDHATSWHAFWAL
jgi:hypothetical protein